MAGDFETSNPVWDTLGEFGSNIINAVRDVQVARASVKTTSAPSGNTSGNTFNPFPGLFGPYPQAEGKPQPGNFFSSASMMPLLLIGGALVLLVALLVRK